MGGVAARRWAVVGVGAVGGLYGGRLAAAGHEVHLVARSDAGVLAAEGLRVDSPGGDFHVHPPVHRHPGTVPEVDAVMVAVKTTANGDLASLLTPFDRSGTLVVLLQNGLGAEAAVAGLLPRAVVLGGLCFVCSHKVGPGHVRHLDFGYVAVAEHRTGGPAGVTPAVEAVVADLVGSGTQAGAEPDLALARWRKLCWNMPFNGLSVVLDAATDQLIRDPDTRALAVGIMTEVVAAARATTGRPLEDGVVEAMVAHTEAMVPYAPSMKLDYDAGRPMEIDAIYGAPRRAAEAAGCPMPLSSALEAQLRFLDRRSSKA
jgi:2-dehydropantoate 2-reductase